MSGTGKRYYPAFLDIERRLVVVIGSGKAAERKARQLSRYGADVLIVTPTPSADLLRAEADGLLGIESRDYVRGDLETAAMAFCYEMDEGVRKAIADEARSRGCLLYVSGDADLTGFIAPSVIHREPLLIAVSTGGLVPELARRVRRDLAERYGEEWGAYVELVAEVRARAAARFEDVDARARVMEAVLDSDVLDRLRDGKQVSAADVLDEFAHAAEPAEPAEPAEAGE